MPIDFTQTLKDMDGNDYPDITRRGTETVTVPMTLSRVACNSLVGAVPNEKPCDGEEHLHRFMLAQRIKDNPAAELSAEDIALIKERIAKSYNIPLIAGQALAMLDPAAAAQAGPKHKPARRAA